MVGGRGGTRTPDPLLAKQMLSQLSYTPTGDDFILAELHRRGQAMSGWAEQSCYRSADRVAYP